MARDRRGAARRARSRQAADAGAWASAGDPAVEVTGLDVAYGAIRAVQSASLRVPTGSVTALVGANGAGKSSILKAIAGMVPAAAGTIRVNGTDLARVPGRDRVTRHGVVLVPEGRSAFVTLTVRENLDLGLRVGRIREAAGAAAGFSLDDAFELFPVLHQRADNRAQVLSGGEQQMLAIARSLLMNPAVLLIDEPSMGLAPLLVRRIFGVMREVFAAHRTSVLLVEQDTAIALELASFAYLLEHGELVAAAPAEELRGDPRLRQAYLGSADALGRPSPPGTAPSLGPTGSATAPAGAAAPDDIPPPPSHRGAPGA